MLSRNEFIQESLELNLFFARIMKEHSIFLKGSFMPNQHNLIQIASDLKVQFENFLAQTVSLAHGIVGPEALSSGEFVTRFTMRAETATAKFTGMYINTNITKLELALGMPITYAKPLVTEQQIFALNQKAIALTGALIQFKTSVYDGVLNCRIITGNYPSMIHHILEEAKFYLKMLQMLQARKDIYDSSELKENEIFWDDKMGEHAEFMRGLLDPDEDKLIQTADGFAKEFKELQSEVQKTSNDVEAALGTKSKTQKAVEDIIGFKTSGVEGILNCKVKSIILPLLADHVLREANHYLMVLKRIK